ncbi:MAG: methyltransferase domain-containing protein [Bacteroidota bacterium]
MSFITWYDFVDLWYKLRERGTGYAAKKLVSDAESRIRSTWDDDELPGSNWWQVDAVRKRWNELITGNEDLIYPDHVVQQFLPGKTGLTMLSIGCGTGQRELEFGKHACFKRIDAFDIAPKAIDDANRSAKELNINICNFFVGDVYKDAWPDEGYDIVLFHSSLHHFTNIDNILARVKATLKRGGLVIINEYVGANRFGFSPGRKKQVNNIYKHHIPDEFKTRKTSNAFKRQVYFPGLLRMVISDPSEAVESSTILPLMEKQFKLIEQKNYGGNLLTFILKDIAHQFNKPGAQPVLKKLFLLEDQMMEKEQQSDFVFAVYKKA